MLATFGIDTHTDSEETIKNYNSCLIYCNFVWNFNAENSTWNINDLLLQSLSAEQQCLICRRSDGQSDKKSSRHFPFSCIFLSQKPVAFRFGLLCSTIYENEDAEKNKSIARVKTLIYTPISIVACFARSFTAGTITHFCRNLSFV